MANANVINLSETAIRTADGIIDVPATMDKLQELVLDLACTEETVSVQVGEVVHALFDKYRGKVITVEDLPGLALASMVTTPDNFADLAEGVRNFVRKNPEFWVNKGKNGGCVRVSDLDAEGLAKMEKSKAAKAAKDAEKATKA